MNTISYTHTRNNLASVLDTAEENHESIIVTRSGKKPSIIMSKDEYDSIQETLHLMSSPRNVARMLESLEDYKAGNFISEALIESV